MATINISLPVDGDTIDAADYNTPITTIVNELNGNLSNANIATSAAISGSKLADASITNAKLDTTLASGWVATTSSVSSVTANGNRSYTVVTGSDLSSVVSPGMRLRTTRTVAAPTQSTSLNGSSQYYSKSSPAGMTGTGTFSIMAWVKLSSYPSGSAGAVMGRMTATAGTELLVDTTGQVIIQYRTASNTTDIKSYQSIPLNRWVHIAGVITNVAGKTGEVYIDGISVPTTSASSATTSYTQPTADLCVGARSGGVLYFPGKIAQAAYFSTNISASTIRSYISQGLSGTESSLVSAYSFNNSITDLNTSTANNLTANGSAVATEADSPFGGQANGTISSTLDYGIVQAINSTTITVQVPEGCTIPTSGGVSAVAYSAFKSPYGFPGQRDKWSILTRCGTERTTSSASYGSFLDAITIPLGAWHISMQALVRFDYGSTGFVNGTVTLSSDGSTQTNPQLTMMCSSTSPSVATMRIGGVQQIEETVNLNATTTFTVIGKVSTTTGAPAIYLSNSTVPAFIIAQNAYL